MIYPRQHLYCIPIKQDEVDMQSLEIEENTKKKERINEKLYKHNMHE